MTIEERDPRDLTPHAMIRDFPRWDREDQNWLGFVNDIREHGVRHPLQITPHNVVIDGETRRQGAIAAGRKLVPVTLVGESESATIILRELALRRNLTKSAMIYLAVRGGLLAKAHEEAVAAMLARRKGQIAGVDSIDSRSIDELTASFGMGRDLFFQAQRVVKIFAEDDAYRVDLEPKVLAGEVGLGAVIAGYAGRKTTAGVDRIDRPTEKLFHQGFQTLILRASRFPDRQQMRVVIRQEVDLVEPDALGLVEEVAQTIKLCVSQRRKTLGTE